MNSKPLSIGGYSVNPGLITKYIESPLLNYPVFTLSIPLYIIIKVFLSIFDLPRLLSL